MNRMKITKEEGFIKFIPETDEETKSLSILWDTLIDCAKFNKKLVPVGEYVPIKRNEARFVIEQ